MPQHFLKSASVRDLTLMCIANMNEDECFEKFKRYRWGNSGQQICHHCGAIDFHYYRKNRRQWRCKHCDGYFSVTSGIIFQDRKLSFKKILMGLMYFISSAAGTAHHEMARDLDMQVKTAEVLVGKLREVICNTQSSELMTGMIQIDGGYFGGRPRNGRLRRKSDPKELANYVESKLKGEKVNNRKPLSGIAYQNFLRRQNRRIVMVVRECSQEKGKGGIRTRVEICKSENENEATQLAYHYVKAGEYIMTDDCPAYNSLSTNHRHDSVQHAIEFSTVDGVNDNQAESYFSRLRRYVKGVGLRSPVKYLYDAANEMAWREDTRRFTQSQKVDALMIKINKYGLSRWWTGYSQGHKRPNEVLWADKVKKYNS